MYKRFIALCLCIFLFTSITFAGTCETADPTGYTPIIRWDPIEEFLMRLCLALAMIGRNASAGQAQDAAPGNTAVIQYELSFNPDIQVLKDQMAESPDRMAIPNIWQGVELLENPDAIDVLANGIYSLYVSGFLTSNSLSMDFATAADKLATADLWIDKWSGGNGLATDLVDVLFYAPQEVVKTSTDFAAQFASTDVAELVSSSLSSLEELLLEKVKLSTTQAGEFPLAHFGTFHSKTTTILTVLDYNLIIRSILENWQHDSSLMALLDSSLRITGDSVTLIDMMNNLKMSFNVPDAFSEEAYLKLSVLYKDGEDAPCFVIEPLLFTDPYERVAWQVNKDVILFERTSTSSEDMEAYAAGTSPNGDMEAGRWLAMDSLGDQYVLRTENLLGANHDEAVSQIDYITLSQGQEQMYVQAVYETLSTSPFYGEGSASVAVYSGDPFVTINLKLEEKQESIDIPNTTGWSTFSLARSSEELKIDPQLIQLLLMRRLSLAFPQSAEELIKAWYQLLSD